MIPAPTSKLFIHMRISLKASIHANLKVSLQHERGKVAAAISRQQSGFVANPARAQRYTQHERRPCRLSASDCARRSATVRVRLRQGSHLDKIAVIFSAPL